MAGLVVLTLTGLCAAESVAAVPDRGGVTFDFPAISARRFAWPQSGTNLVAAVAAGGTYRISFEYTMSHPELSHRVNLYGLGGVDVLADGKKAGRLCVWYDRGDWTPYSNTVDVPEGTKRLELKPRDERGGRLSLRNIRIAAERRSPVELMIPQVQSLDGTFAVSRGQLAFMCLFWRKTKDSTFDRMKAEFTVELPKHVELVHAESLAEPGSLVSQVGSDGHTVTTFRARRNLWISQDWNRYGHRGMLLRGAANAPDRCGVGRVTLRAEGKVVARSVEIDFLAIDPIPKVVAAKRYRDGIDFAGGLQMMFGQPSGEAYADFLADCGVRCIVYEGNDAKTAGRLRAAGVDLLTPSTEYCANGYGIRHPRKPIPPEVQFVPYDARDADFAATARKSMCPVAVYTECDYFRNEFLPFLKGYLADADGLWANWEPHTFRHKGCACVRCRAAFAKHLSVSEAEVAAVWTNRPWKTYGKRYDDFRSAEHAKLVRVLQRYVTKYTGGEKGVGFIAGVEWSFMGPCWRDEDPAPEYRIRDFAEDFRWIEIWGPYAWWESNLPYVYLPNRPLANFVAAKAMRAQVDADYPLPKRPKIMAYPHGLQGVHCISQPEHISMSLDCYFFNRWQAAYVYHFPKGYDNRYWRAFATAAARAGRYEDFVLDGRESTSSCKVTPVKEYPAPCACATYYVPAETNVTYLQHAAFDLNGSRIVAVLNFWQRGEAFFTLKAEGLTTGEYAVVDEEGLFWANPAGGRTWTAAALARGIRLMVGAARTRVFEIVPVPQAPKAKAVAGDEEIRRLYRSRRGELRRAAEEEDRNQRCNPPPRRDYMPVI